MGSEKLKDATNSVNFQHPCAGNVTIFDRDKAIVEETCPDGSPRKRVAIVGFAGTTKDQAPYNDPTWSIWGLNQLYRHIPRADRWFEIHANWNEHVVEGTDHQKWLADAQIPIYMVNRVEGIPNSVRYPIERMLAGTSDYFTSTVAFMVALAIEEGFQEIGLWGIDMVANSEYAYQRPCVEFWLGIAHGKGITVTLPQDTALCTQTHRYGYEVEPKSLILLSELIKRKSDLLDKRQKMLIDLAYIDGALQDCQMWGDLADLRSKGSTVGI